MAAALFRLGRYAASYDNAVRHLWLAEYVADVSAKRLALVRLIDLCAHMAEHKAEKPKYERELRKVEKGLAQVSNYLLLSNLL